MENKEINIESNTFNNIFAFSYKGPKKENILEIVKTLSPAVQEKLIAIGNSKKNAYVFFKENTVTFMFDGLFFKDLKTNLKTSLEIKSEDKEFMEQQITSLVEISSELIKYLD